MSRGERNDGKVSPTAGSVRLAILGRRLVWRRSRRAPADAAPVEAAPKAWERRAVVPGKEFVW